MSTLAEITRYENSNEKNSVRHIKISNYCFVLSKRKYTENIDIGGIQTHSFFAQGS